MRVRNCAFCLLRHLACPDHVNHTQSIHTTHRHSDLYCNICFLKEQVGFHCYDETSGILPYSFIDTSHETVWDGCHCSVYLCLDISPIVPPTPHIRLATKLPHHGTSLYSSCSYLLITCVSSKYLICLTNQRELHRNTGLGRTVALRGKSHLITHRTALLYSVRRHVLHLQCARQ